MSIVLQRLVGVLGVLYVVVTIAPAFFLPPPPARGAPVADIANYYQRHQNALLLFGWIGLLAFPLGFAFVSGLSLRLKSDGGLSTWLLTVALVSISVTLAVAAVQGILALAVPYFAATGALVLLSRALPAWLGYGAFIVAAIAVAGSLGVIVRSGPLAAGGPTTLLALVVGLLWWLIAAVFLLVRPRVV